MGISDLLVRLLELLRIKKPESEELRLKLGELQSKKAAFVDRRESLKDDVSTLEQKALKKKKEYDAAKAHVKQIIAGEIEGILKELDRSKEREAIIRQNIERLSLAIEKHKVAISGKGSITEDDLDEVALLMEETVSQQKRLDKTAQDLEGISYKAPEAAKVDVESRMAELEGKDEPAKKSSAELSQSTTQRLKELAGAEE